MEYRARDRLVAKGFVVMRAAQSLGKVSSFWSSPLSVSLMVLISVCVPLEFYAFMFKIRVVSRSIDKFYRFVTEDPREKP